MKVYKHSSEKEVCHCEEGRSPDVAISWYNLISCVALQTMADMGTVWVPTLSTIGNLRGKGRFSEDAVRRILDSALENVNAFAGMGGLVAPGSDAGAWAVPHGSMTEESLLEMALGQDTQKVLDKGIQKIKEKF